MEEINYFMVDEAKTACGGPKKRPEEIRFSWRGNRVTLHLLPGAWFEKVVGKPAARRMLMGKVARYVDSQRKEPGTVWISAGLEQCFPGYRPPVPPPSLAALFWKEQPFREILILWTKESFWQQSGRWRELFLRECFPDLNGLFVVGARPEEGDGFFEELYGQSGLSTCFCPTLPRTDGRKTAVIDLCAGKRPPVERLAPASLYLDLTSDSKKQEFFREKRPDIPYQSVRNYLDTVMKARYNAI